MLFKKSETDRSAAAVFVENTRHDSQQLPCSHGIDKHSSTSASHESPTNGLVVGCTAVDAHPAGQTHLYALASSHSGSVCMVCEMLSSAKETLLADALLSSVRSMHTSSDFQSTARLRVGA